MKKIPYAKLILTYTLVWIVGYSCDEVLVPNLKDKKITLLAPANGIASEDTAIIFYWQSLDSLRYQLQVVTPTFDTIRSLITDTLTYKNQLKLTLSKGDYQWRVRAINEASQGPYSPIWNLKIK